MTTIEFKVKKTKCGEWFFPEQTSPLMKRWAKCLKENEKRMIGGIEMHFKEVDLEGNILLGTYTSADMNQALQKGIEYVQLLFRRPIDIAYIEVNSNQKARLPHHFGIKTCSTLVFFGDVEMRDSDLQETLENVMATKSVYIQIPVSNKCIDPKLIKSKEVFFTRNHNWVNKDHLLDFTCPRISFAMGKNSLRPDDVNAFVHRWFHSDDTSFEMILVRMIEYEQSSNFSEYQPMEWCKTRRAQFYEYMDRSAVNLSEGYDIQRSDGLLATVFFKMPLFFFCVWHDRFPELSHIESWM